jgi:DnaJ-like protein/PilZ domain-containing protein
MARGQDMRRHKRKQVEYTLSASWKDEDGVTKFNQAKGVDLSESGIRIECAEPMEVGRYIHVRVDELGLVGTAVVRHCSSRGAKYVIGLELSDGRQSAQEETGEEFVDFYEIMQISPTAEAETVHRVHKMLAARYHPDNPETGDTEMFLLLTRAYETLSHPEMRAIYDASYQVHRTEPLPIFELKEFLGGVQGEAHRRLGMLCLLYNKRRQDPDHPGLSLLEFERIMTLPREHLLFTVWFLKEKNFIRIGHGADYEISAEGADYVEEKLPSHRLLYKLLQEGEAGQRERGTVPDNAR